MKESSKYNVRYVGFESLADGGRRVDYAITAQGAPARSASIHVPAAAFTGPNRVTFQEIATIGCEKIRRELETQPEIQIDTMSGANASPVGRSHQDMSGANASPVGRSHQDMTLSAEDIEEFRPRRRAAGKRP